MGFWRAHWEKNMEELFYRHSALRKIFATPIELRRRWLRRKGMERRAVVANLQKFVREDVKVRVDGFGGDFMIAPTSHLFTRLLLEGDYEPDITSLFIASVQEDCDVIDVGANVGFFTVAAAKRLRMGRVLSIEPSSAALQRLQENLKLNSVEDRVILFPGLASSSEGSSDLYSIPGMEEYSSASPIVHKAVAKRATVKEAVSARTIDGLVAEYDLRPKLIKVDVEGAEGLVFEGAVHTITEHRPIIISELSPELLSQFGSTPADIISLFDRIGYAVVDPKLPGAPPGSRRYGDIVCHPRSSRRS